MIQNEYDVKVVDVIDGDTVDIDIYLGFGVELKDERVRIVGIDAEESRTSDKVEDLFGEAAKARVKELMDSGAKLITKEDNHGEDMKGKFGRILGDFRLPSGKTLTETLVEEHLAVPYHGQSKDDILAQHLANREILLEKEVVSKKDYDNAVKIMESR